jgi:type VI secretion system protein ImpK
MEEDNPFNDATIIRPNPGGRLRSAAPAGDPAAAAPASVAAARAPANPALLNTSAGLGTLVDAASPILGLVSRLAMTISQQDVEELRRRVREAFGEFERRAAAAGLRPETLGACHYALCATVDDVASNMPWGSRNVWADQSMARVFHNDTSGGERFFELLQHFERDPETHFEVLELFYFCLSLGFQGRFRLLAEGASDLAGARARLHRIIRRRRGEVAAELSPHWRGIEAPHRPLTAFVPLWAIGAGVALVLLLIFIVLHTLLGRGTDQLYAKLAGLPNLEKPQIEGWSKPLPPPPPPPPKVAPQLSVDIQSSCVAVQEAIQIITVRLHCNGLFAPGSAALEDRFGPTVDDIANALKTVPGTLTVIGYTDNQPIHNLRFPSNFELSLARAQSVRDRLVKDGVPADQIKVDGKGEKDPIADNNTAEGREANRRIEFILLRSADQK